MSDEVKFRLSFLVNIAILVSIIAGGVTGIVTGVQWKDSVEMKLKVAQDTLDKLVGMDSKMAVVQETLRIIQDKQITMDTVEKRVDAQNQHMVVEEQRQMNTESKVDALTSLLNEFMGSIRSGVTSSKPHLPEPSPSP